MFKFKILKCMIIEHSNLAIHLENSRNKQALQNKSSKFKNKHLKNTPKSNNQYYIQLFKVIG